MAPDQFDINELREMAAKVLDGWAADIVTTSHATSFHLECNLEGDDAFWLVRADTLKGKDTLLARNVSLAEAMSLAERKVKADRMFGAVVDLSRN